MSHLENWLAKPVELKGVCGCFAGFLTLVTTSNAACAEKQCVIERINYANIV